MCARRAATWLQLFRHGAGVGVSATGAGVDDDVDASDGSGDAFSELIRNEDGGMANDLTESSGFSASALFGTSGFGD